VQDRFISLVWKCTENLSLSARRIGEHPQRLVSV
jgi:hypothetical protein